MKKVLGVLAVAGLASSAMAQSFDGQARFVAGHLAGSGPAITEFTVNAPGTYQFTIALGAFNAQGFTNYGMFNWVGALSHNGAGITLSNSPGNRAPFTANPVGNGTVGPAGITGIDAARNVVNISVPWNGDIPPNPPVFTQGNNSLFNDYRFTVTVNDLTARDIVFTATGAMQAISGWTTIDPGEPDGAATFTATAFVTDATANGTFVLHIVPAPGAAALLGLGGLVAARRRR